MFSFFKKGPEIAKTEDVIGGLSPRTQSEYLSPRSTEIHRTPPKKEVPNTPIRINGVVYYPQTMHQESSSKISLQNELVNSLQQEVNECNRIIDDLRGRSVL